MSVTLARHKEGSPGAAVCIAAAAGVAGGVEQDGLGAWGSHGHPWSAWYMASRCSGVHSVLSALSGCLYAMFVYICMCICEQALWLTECLSVPQST